MWGRANLATNDAEVPRGSALECAAIHDILPNDPYPPTGISTMLALVTGATGFLGRRLTQLLHETGTRVRGLVRSDDALLRQQGIELAFGDIRDQCAVQSAMRDVDVVFHTAALAGIWGRDRDFYDVNVTGTQNVIHACRASGTRRLVFTSSPSVTFNGTDQLGIDESAPYSTRWLATYPRTKALAEQAVLAANDAVGLRTCSLRPHLIWGPGDRHLIPRLLQRARQGRLRRIGDGTNRIDTIHIDNAAQAHLLADRALERDPANGGRAYFLAQGQPVNCWDWINHILDLARLPPVRRSISFKNAWILGGALEGIYRMCGFYAEPRMTRFLAAQLATSHYFDISAARRDLGYEPRISLDEGMRNLADELAIQPLDTRRRRGQ